MSLIPDNGIRSESSDIVSIDGCVVVDESRRDGGV
jgi:hypothetical protein